MKRVCIVCLLAFACGAYAKQKQQPIDPCDLQPALSRSSAVDDNKAKINADLMSLKSALINPGFDGEFSKTVDDTYQAIPEKDIACRLMLQEVSCIVTARRDAIRDDMTNNLIEIVGKKNVCQASGLQVVKQTLQIK